ncbi:MAG: T9SS type A sorting domain-containing protein [Clostridia bacterium]|nr:T9SS type A sorting domain-containing protein [Clostridia bacterium]
MKKLSIMLLLSFFTTFIFAQSENENCITCDSNMVDFTKGASAIGSKNTSSGINSLAAGYQNEASGDYSVAMPFLAKALGDRSFALGYNSIANGSASLAIGAYSKTSQNAMLSIALGSKVTSVAVRSMTIGYGFYDTPIENNISNSLMIGFNSDRSTFFVGSSAGIGTTGKIGIGNITQPEAKLHIRADENEDAILKLDAPGTNRVARLILADDDNTITAVENGGMSFHTPAAGNFKFINGKVGIGLNAPETKLDVDGTLKSTGFKLVDGSQAYGRILQSDDQGNATWVDAPGGGCVQCEGGDNSGTNASIIGTNNIASGNSSFAGGEDSEAQGKQSFAFGENALTMSAYSVAMGQEVTAFGGASIVLGRNLMTTTSAAMIIGTGFDDTHNLINDKHSSLMVGFNSTKPTFFVSESNGSNSTGKIGIGNVTDPQAKLHILGDANSYNPTEASLLIESAGNQYSTLWIGDKNHSIYTRPDSDFKFSTSLNTNFVFENGNVGIGTNEPAAKIQVKDGDIFIEDIDRGIIMKSPDGNCWRGTVNNQGQMQFTQIDCSTLETGTQSPEPSGASTIKIYPNPAKAQVVIDCSNSKEVLYLEVTDMSGKLMHRQTIPNAVNTLSSADWPAGMYFFNFKNNRGTSVETIKVVKEE